MELAQLADTQPDGAVDALVAMARSLPTARSRVRGLRSSGSVVDCRNPDLVIRKPVTSLCANSCNPEKLLACLNAGIWILVSSVPANWISAN